MIEVTDKYLKGLSFIDLFAGIGGFHYALSSYGAECLYASEWDKPAQETYFANFGIMPTGDITKIAAEEIPSHDILCGGFPCQAFSVSGKRLGFEDTRGTLFFDIARIVKHHKPKVVFMENVNIQEKTNQASQTQMTHVGCSLTSSPLQNNALCLSGYSKTNSSLYLMC